MDSYKITEELSRFFKSVSSFETDPSNLSIKLPENEQIAIKQTVDKSIKLLIEKLIDQNTPPIAVTLNSSGDQNPDILKAFQDKRYMSNVYNLIENNVKVYLTPRFLDYFDFQNSMDRMYLKSKIKFLSAQLGFQAKAYSNKFKGGT